MDKLSLINLFQSKNAKIGVIGLGYVGLPLALRFAKVGFKTIGFDIDIEKIKKLNAGKTYIKHISADRIKTAINSKLRATVDFSEIATVNAILICVPTPFGIYKEPDLSYIRSTFDSIESHLKENQLLVLESTSYPGTTEEEILPFIQGIFSKSNIKISKPKFNVGKNFFIGYSPEREDPGNKDFTTKTIPKVVSGYTENCLEVTKKLYDQIVDRTVPVSSPKVAEMTKIMENIHRAVNIGLVNELKMVADKIDIDIYEVINAASTKPFGFTPYYPGPGLGGHCLPIDPFYLVWKAKKVGMNIRFIELAEEINTAMPAYVVEKVNEALESVGKTIKTSKIFVLGLSYKKNVDDIRESPSLVIMDILINMGADLQYSDPYLQKVPKTRKYNFDLESVEVSANNIKSFDAVLLITDHDEFDYKLIEKESKLIIDTRGKFDKSQKIIVA
jgi:UDP-N-acetyl-D-glucosamine dehydrogenase